MRAAHLPIRTGVRGISLIEALVAMAVMAFGMLALVGVQANLRASGDVARQTTEATRLASDRIESLRGFDEVTGSVAAPDFVFADIAGDPAFATVVSGTVSISGPDGSAIDVPIVNTVFQQRRQVTPIQTVPAGLASRVTAARAIVVDEAVQWRDRRDQGRQVALSTVIAGVAPQMSGVAAILPTETPLDRIRGRHRALPDRGMMAMAGGGSSALAIRVGSGADVQTEYLIFANETGRLLRRCTALTAHQNGLQTDPDRCTHIKAQVLLVRGTIWFDGRVGDIDARVAAEPAGPAQPLDPSRPLHFSTSIGQSSDAQCLLAGELRRAGDTGPTVGYEYLCLVFPDSAAGWGGKLDLRADGSWRIGAPSPDAPADDALWRVCRYTNGSSDHVANIDHPRTYCQTVDGDCSDRVRRHLTNQNFLVIRAQNSCPTDAAIDLAQGRWTTRNTRPHQP